MQDPTLIPMKKKLYIGFSFYDLFVSVILRLILIVAIIYLCTHYRENPVLISILLCLCAVFMLIIGDDMIIVYGDKLVKTDHSFATLIFSMKDKVYYFNEMKRAQLAPQKPAPTVSEAAIVFLGVLMTKQRGNINNRPNYFTLEMKTGDIVKILTALSDRQINDIVTLTNQYIETNKKHQ